MMCFAGQRFIISRDVLLRSVPSIKQYLIKRYFINCNHVIRNDKSNNCSTQSIDSSSDHFKPAASMPELSDAENEIIQRIIELQREKERLLRLMDQSNNDSDTEH
ncbi:hypothetical protein IW150_006137 [Coemansia sp. RSA 2607]|nr:hypothetical protein IW150_006137 [Coemansia sp. RSA 2607]